ncbi:hypothetical protein RCO28_37990 [Streptomyces sp. LHD-70]|uniref:hypothetical protein n=1 Tax=Streptomyces sp. LHD-70 TaxID=3072140 RepID=UPI00280F6E7A|nr:hypothetical protein [Streptomyces sp. LHD-70]MDQ8708210.1 hypothetical protein [Streptomyces sp. LHD-70]
MDDTTGLKLPYLGAPDKLDDWPRYYKRLAERVERVLANKETVPPGEVAVSAATARLGLNWATTSAGWLAPPIEPFSLAGSDFSFGDNSIVASVKSLVLVVATVIVNHGQNGPHNYIRCQTVNQTVYGGVKVNPAAPTVRGLITLATAGVVDPAASHKGVMKLELRSFIGPDEGSTTAGNAIVHAGEFTVIRLGDAP